MKTNTTKQSNRLHGNTITKRTIIVTSEDYNKYKDIIESIFASGKIAAENIIIYSVTEIYYKEV